MKKLLRKFNIKGAWAAVSRGLRIFILISLACALLAVGFFVARDITAGTLKSQQAAETWRGGGETEFSQVSLFLPDSAGFSTDKIRPFREKITADTLDILPENVVNAYTDAWSTTGSVTIASDTTSTSASVIAVGGNYFLFHPIDLVSGVYFTEGDVMDDRVLLDKDLAWRLFGGMELTGLTVKLNGENFVIAGVIDRESDFASTAAYTAGAGLYMSYSAYERISAGGEGASAPAVNCYEVVMPNPVENFAVNLVTEQLNADGSAEVVENSARYERESILNVLTGYSERTLRENEIQLPYWENAARITENRCAVFLLLELLFWLCPAICALLLLIKLYKYTRRKLRVKYLDVKDRYENRTLFAGRKGKHLNGRTDV